MTKATAGNTKFLTDAKRAWNGKIYKKASEIYNEQGMEAAANFLQQYVTIRIEGATIPVPGRYQMFTDGQRVKNDYGQLLTVRNQTGCQVFVEEGGWYHPSKLHLI